MSWLTEPRDGASRAAQAEFAADNSSGTEISVIGKFLAAAGSLSNPGRVLGRRNPAQLSDAMKHRNSVPLSAAPAVTAVATIGLFINAVVEFNIAAFVLLRVVKATSATTTNHPAALSA